MPKELIIKNSAGTPAAQPRQRPKKSDASLKVTMEEELASNNNVIFAPKKNAAIPRALKRENANSSKSAEASTSAGSKRAKETPLKHQGPKVPQGLKLKHTNSMAENGEILNLAEPKIPAEGPPKPGASKLSRKARRRLRDKTNSLQENEEIVNLAEPKEPQPQVLKLSKNGGPRITANNPIVAPKIDAAKPRPLKSDGDNSTGQLESSKAQGLVLSENVVPKKKPKPQKPNPKEDISASAGPMHCNQENIVNLAEPKEPQPQVPKLSKNGGPRITANNPIVAPKIDAAKPRPLKCDGDNSTGQLESSKAQGFILTENVVPKKKPKPQKRNPKRRHGNSQMDVGEISAPAGPMYCNQETQTDTP